MKVLCIDDSIGRTYACVPSFKFGDTLNIKDVDGDYYLIQDHEFCKKTGELVFWHKDRFVPLSDIDETQLIKERQLVNA